MNDMGMMKAFMLMADISNDNEENKIAAQERIVFATPGIIKPEDWDMLPIATRKERLGKLLEML